MSLFGDPIAPCGKHYVGQCDCIWPVAWTSTTSTSTACNCVGGPNCCIKRAERDRDEAMREEGRREERQRWLTRDRSDDPTVTDEPVEQE